jgi:hypothetical protein
MPTYTFHHYGHGGGPSGITFADCDTDEAALTEARRLLEWHELRCVEVCEFRREVGAVKWDAGQILVEPPGRGFDAGAPTPSAEAP